MDRDFKGVWFPKEVWLDERLSALDKIILLEIDSLDNEEKGCYASNEYLAEFCQCSERKITESISKLIKFEYVYVESFNGRQRVLKSRLSDYARQSSKNCEAEKQKIPQRNIIDNTNIDNIDNKDNKSKEKENIKEKKEEELETISKIFDFWNSLNIIKHSKLNEIRIKAIKKKLKDYSIDAIKTAIEHYAIVLHDNNSFWNYTWSLEDFLNRKNGFTTFLDDGSNCVSYNKNKNPYSTQKEISRETKYPNQKDKGYIY